MASPVIIISCFPETARVFSSAFIVLLHTGLRVSELLGLDLDQYKGKHFVNVKRKGKKVSRQVFLSTEAREALTRYLEVRGKQLGPMFCSRAGERTGRQNV